MPGWMSYKLESKLEGETSTNSIWGGYHPQGRERRELKSLLMRVEEESESAGLKLTIKKTKIMTSGPITAWQIEGEKVEAVRDFLLLGSKITADGDCSPGVRRHFLPGRKAMTKLNSVLKSRDITRSTKSVCQGNGLPSGHLRLWDWTIKKAECRRIDAFELWCWRTCLRVPWTQGDQTSQS